MEITETLKRHWPYVLGGVAGLYLIYKYMGSSSTSSSTSTVDPNALAYAQGQSQLQAQTTLGMAQIQANSNAATAAQNLQSAQLAAQSNNATQQNEIAYNTALGSTASSVGNSIAQVIQAQSVLPAVAINSAMQENQTTLQASAATAIAGINAVPQNTAAYGSIITTQLGQQTQANKDFYTSLSNSGQQVVASNMSAMNNTMTAYDAYSQSNPMIVNSVGSSSSSQVSSVAGAAATGAAANASGTASTMSTIGTIGAAMLMY